MASKMLDNELFGGDDGLYESLYHDFDGREIDYLYEDIVLEMMDEAIGAMRAVARNRKKDFIKKLLEEVD